MVQIIKVDFHLVGPNDIVVIPFGIGLLGEQFFLVAVLDAGGTCDAGTELKNTAVIALQLVGIAWHIGPRPNKAHLSDEDIDQLGEAVHLAVTQPMAYPCNSRIVGNGDGIALGLLVHGAELTDSKRLTLLSNAPLQEKQRSLGVQFDEDGDNKQGKKQQNKPHQCHDTVEAPFKKEPYFVFIFLHAA